MDLGNAHPQVFLPMSFVCTGVFSPSELEHLQFLALNRPSYLGYHLGSCQDRRPYVGPLIVFHQQDLVQLYGILPSGDLTPFDINNIPLAEAVLFSAVFYDCLHCKLQKGVYFAKSWPWPFDQSTGMLS